MEVSQAAATRPGKDDAALATAMARVHELEAHLKEARAGEARLSAENARAVHVLDAYEEDKASHRCALEAVRRQCEQLEQDVREVRGDRNRLQHLLDEVRVTHPPTTLSLPP